jgi:hypothetical protein
MSVMVVELYEALRKAGLDEDIAQAAAKAVSAVGTDLVTTKAEIRADLAELKAELMKMNVGTLVAVTAIFSAIVKLF